MRLPEPIHVKALAERLGAELIGTSDQYAHGINEIHKVRPGDITFVDIEKYYRKSLESSASIILINKRVEAPEGKTLLLVDNPFAAYDKLVRQYNPFRPMQMEWAEDAVIHPTAIIEPYVCIGPGVHIGEGCYIQAHTYIGHNTLIRNRVIIQAGCMIGTDAFYFKNDGTSYHKWHSGGHVEIEDDVFIGASCTINRGVSGITRIGQGSKLDSQVHIGHGVVIGKHCLLAGQVGIGGKTIVGDRVKVYGQAGIANNLTVGDDAVILAKAGVLKSIVGGKSYFGLPAEDARERFMQLVAIKQLVADRK